MIPYSKNPNLKPKTLTLKHLKQNFKPSKKCLKHKPQKTQTNLHKTCLKPTHQNPNPKTLKVNFSKPQTSTLKKFKPKAQI
jgi:hypothetical protein